MKFLENPSRRRRRKVRRNPRRQARTKRRPPAGWSSWKAYMASIRKKRKTATTSARSNPVAKRRRRSRSGGARRHRSFRRNPPMVKSIIRTAIQGVQDGALVVAGEAISNIIPNLARLPKTGLIGMAARAASVVGAGLLAHRFIGADRARFVIAGGLGSVLRGAAVGYFPAAATAFASYPMGSYALGALAPDNEQPLMLGESYFADMGMTEEEYQGAQ